jgi:hypothetical protein
VRLTCFPKPSVNPLKKQLISLQAEYNEVHFESSKKWATGEAQPTICRPQQPVRGASGCPNHRLNTDIQQCAPAYLPWLPSPVAASCALYIQSRGLANQLRVWAGPTGHTPTQTPIGQSQRLQHHAAVVPACSICLHDRGCWRQSQRVEYCTDSPCVEQSSWFWAGHNLL